MSNYFTEKNLKAPQHQASVTLSEQRGNTRSRIIQQCVLQKVADQAKGLTQARPMPRHLHAHLRRRCAA
jgi:hypothetical protein